MRFVYLLTAAFFFVLALAGVILPGFPATPFLLLCSYCLVRSSPALNERLLRSKIFGPILRDWQEHHGIQRHIKLKATFVVAASVAATLYFGGRGALQLVLCGVLVAIGLTVIWTLPEVPTEGPLGEPDSESEAQD